MWTATNRATGAADTLEIIMIATVALTATRITITRATRDKCHTRRMLMVIQYTIIVNSDFVMKHEIWGWVWWWKGKRSISLDATHLVITRHILRLDPFHWFCSPLDAIPAGIHRCSILKEDHNWRFHKELAHASSQCPLPVPVIDERYAGITYSWNPSEHRFTLCHQKGAGQGRLRNRVSCRG